MQSSFVLQRQYDAMDCGPACLTMVARHFGLSSSLTQLRTLCDKGKQGVTLLGISEAARDIGLNSMPMRLERDVFIKEATLPCIVHWQQNHFVVVHRITAKSVYIADPAKGKMKLSHDAFFQYWSPNDKDGIALLLKPGDAKSVSHDPQHDTRNGFSVLLSKLRHHKSLLSQLGIGALLVSLFNFSIPFLTQSMVDQGIGNGDENFLLTILIAQAVIFLGRTTVEFIRGWVLSHLGTRINVALVSEFLGKMLRVSLSWYQRRSMGDILQRIADQQKIEEFLTSQTLGFIFSVLNMLVFSIVIATYNLTIFTIFILGSCVSIWWVTLFLSRRKVLDYQYFNTSSDNQNSVMQLVSGIDDVKLNSAGPRFLWKWEVIQAKLFKLRLKLLALEQWQQGGSMFLNETKNISITVFSAYLVMQGEITLGMMMAIAFMLGQMNAPVDQALTFIKQAQDAKLGIDRLGEIQQEPDDELPQQRNIPIDVEGDLVISQLNYRYSRHDKKPVICNLDLIIPSKKTTAIVGASGSGKTTLLKLLLQFDRNYEGHIELGEQDLKHVSPDAWRQKCGVVMQDGFIFNDNIVNNIAPGQHEVDMERVVYAAKMANLHDEISQFPESYYTILGDEGIGLSGGQKQRVLIARAIYKNPHFIFLDEATSSLDANNESKIQENLNYFFKGRTVVVIAHRLSTVKKADQIVVLDKGEIVEVGSHATLTQQKGHYFELVKNQLELGR